jgi:succinate dehydrogenase / fumarate reductase flavoprotein subunit/L-aspartate oxidase
VLLEADGATAVPGLYVAGEISGGVHGHNRLMGNSLLEITVFGRRTGRAAAAWAQRATAGSPILAHVEAWQRGLEEAGIEPEVTSPILLPDYTRRA